MRKFINNTLNNIKLRLKEITKPLVRRSFFYDLARNYEHLLNEKGTENFIYANKKRLRLLTKLKGIRPSEGYILIEKISQTRDIPGSVCEFGIAMGTTSALIANEIRSGKKILHLFDSFLGPSKP